MTAKIVYIKTEDLHPAPFNPLVRTTGYNLRELKMSMEKDGFWEYNPIKITQDKYIADGHRRWTVAKELGIKKIPCIYVTGKTLEQAWSDINATMRTITSREIFQAYEGGLRYLPAGGAGKKVTAVLEKYGHEMLMYCAEHGVSRGMFQWAESIADYIGMSGEQEYIVEKIIPWLVELKMQKIGRWAVETGYNRNEFKRKIDEFIPISLS